MRAEIRCAVVLCAVSLPGPACSDSSPTSAGDDDDDDQVVVGQDGPGNPNGRLACERAGYPCTWSEVGRALAERSNALGDDVARRLDSGESPAAARAWVAGQPGVAESQADAVAVRFRLAGAAPVWVLGPDAVLIDDTPAPAPGLPSPPIRTTDVVGDAPKPKRALILSPYFSQFGSSDAGPGIAALLSATRDYAGNVDFRSNTNDPAHFSGWGGYDVIYAFTHGTQLCDATGCVTVVSAGLDPGGTVVASNHVGVTMMKTQQGSHVGLETDFFRNAYPGGLPDAIVYLTGCMTAKSNDLAQTLSGGGGAYLGWSESVWSGDGQRAAHAFFAELVAEGVPATSAHGTMASAGGTTGRTNPSGAVPTLELHTSGDDLRIREVVELLHPLTEEVLPANTPYPVVGQPEDGMPDKIPFLVRVDGVEGDPSGFVVHVEVNGIAGPPVPLSNGEMITSNMWKVKGEVPVTFDAQQGQPVTIKARVDLPEGGQSEWEDPAPLGNPGIRFVSEIESTAPASGIRVLGRVETEFTLSLSSDLETLEGHGDLQYPVFTVQTPISGGCTLSTTAIGGTLNVREVVLQGAGTQVPQEVLLFPVNDTYEQYTVTCPEGAQTIDMFHWFSGFISMHAGLCGVNELDQSRGAIVIRGWAAGAGDIMASKRYDQTCNLGESNARETTTIELISPEST